MNNKGAEMEQVVWFTHFEHRVGPVGREGLVNYILVLTREYLLLSQWIPVPATTYSVPVWYERLFTRLH